MSPPDEVSENSRADSNQPVVTKLSKLVACLKSAFPLRRCSLPRRTSHIYITFGSEGAENKQPQRRLECNVGKKIFGYSTRHDNQGGLKPARSGATNQRVLLWVTKRD